MKKIFFFCIPAHGHTNPMLPVAAELVKRGNTVRFYSFNDFKDKIKTTGAEYISCDAHLPELTKQEESGLKKVSSVLYGNDDTGYPYYAQYGQLSR